MRATTIGVNSSDDKASSTTAAQTGGGMLFGGVSGVLPESVERAEQILRRAQEVLSSGCKTNDRNGDRLGDNNTGPSTEELEQLSFELKRVLFVCPNHKELHAVRGEVHRRLQDFRTAVMCLRVAVSMDKSAFSVRQKLAEVLQSQGLVWLDAGQNDAALACFEDACAADGVNASAHFSRTVALVKLRRLREALGAMESVLGCRRGTADDYVLRAKIRWALGMVTQGNIDMAKAQELCHDHPEVLMFQRRCLGAAENTFAKARARVDAGDDQMALKLLDMANTMTPDDIKVFVERAACKRRLRDFIGALQDYDEAAFKHFAAVHVGQRALHTAASTLHHKDVAGANGDGSTTIRRRGEGSASGKKNTGDSQGAESKGSQDRLGASSPGGAVEAAGAIAEDSATAMQHAAKERQATEELRKEFRFSVRYAGLDPAYHLDFPLVQPPAAYRQGHFGRRGIIRGKKLRRSKMSFRGDLRRLRSARMVTRAGGVELINNVHQERERRLAGSTGGDDAFWMSDESSNSTRDGGGGCSGETHHEPSYTTSQRCLVLNDWALDLLARGEHSKAVSASTLAIEGDRAYANFTGECRASQFFVTRGDCHCSKGWADHAAADYQEALELEPGNWMIKTRLSIAYYLKGNGLFNQGRFLLAKEEFDRAIGCNWKVSEYFVCRGQAQFFNGHVTGAHGDYKRALELDPGNLEARRLCRQFDSKGRLLDEAARRSELSSKTPPAARRVQKDWFPKPSTVTPSPPAARTTACSSLPRDVTLELHTQGVCHYPSEDKVPESRRPFQGVAYEPPNDHHSSSVVRRTSSSPSSDSRTPAARAKKIIIETPETGTLPAVSNRLPKTHPTQGVSVYSWAKRSKEKLESIVAGGRSFAPPRDERIWGMLSSSAKAWESVVDATPSARRPSTVPTAKPPTRRRRDKTYDADEPLRSLLEAMIRAGVVSTKESDATELACNPTADNEVRGNATGGDDPTTEAPPPRSLLEAMIQAGMIPWEATSGDDNNMLPACTLDEGEMMKLKNASQTWKAQRKPTISMLAQGQCIRACHREARRGLASS